MTLRGARQDNARRRPREMVRSWEHHPAASPFETDFGTGSMSSGGCPGKSRPRRHELVKVRRLGQKRARAGLHLENVG